MNPHLAVSVVLPACNEGQGIARTLETVAAFLSLRCDHYELIVVDDGSTDRTADIVSSWRPLSGASIRLLANRRQLGKGASVRRGVLESKGDIVIFMDSDLPYELQAIDDFVLALSRGYDLAIGSRVEPASLVRGVSLGRLITGRIFSWLIQALVMRGIPDTQCGFKAFTRDAAQQTFRRLSIPGFGFDVELLFIARRQGYRIQRIPVRMTEVSHRSSTVHPLRDPVRMLRDLFAIRWNDLRGKYA